MLMAVLAMVTIVALATGLMWTSRTELNVADGYRDMSLARSAADSGLQYFVLMMKDCRSGRMHIDETPDMFEVVHSHLTAKLPSTPPTMSGTGLERVISLPEISLNTDNSGACFSMELRAMEGMVDPDTNLPTMMKLIVTGRHGETQRKVWALFNIEADDDILNHSIASMIRVIIRGNNTVINGDIASSWERAVSTYRGESYPFDIGSTNSGYRALEHIEINHMKKDGTILLNGGKLGTSLSREQFDGQEELPNGWGWTDCNDGIRHESLQTQVKCGPDDGDKFSLTHEDFDTSKYRDRAETSDGFSALNTPDSIGDDEKVTLPYPVDNEPTGYATYNSDRVKFQDSNGNWCYGYPHEGTWVVYNQNPSGNWEFGYYDNSNNWVKVNRNPSTDAPIGRYRENNGYIYMGDALVTDPCPNPQADAKIVYERWSGSLGLWRAYYANYNGSDNPKFKNLHIPKGSHAHFKNCTFTGITYVETDEETDLTSGSGSGYSRYNSLRENATIGSGAGSTNTEACNNVVFENCTFEGPIISGVPKDLRFQDNAVQFIGSTVFDATAIREELQGTTIMMPNYNVNIGDFDQTATGSESEIVGILVGGIVDIRDNAVINGTLINMTSLDHLSDTQVCGGWGSNIGNYEGSTSETYVPYDTYEINTTGDINQARTTPFDFNAITQSFSPSENIVITPDPGNVIPYGMRVRYALVIEPQSFGEGD
jgi:hypothetical protein